MNLVTDRTTAPPRSLLDSRARAIRDLLFDYRDLVDPLNGPGGVRGDGGSVSLLPHERRCALMAPASSLMEPSARCTCAYRCVRELERILRAMREDRTASLQLVDGQKVSVRRLWWNVNQRYIAAPVRIAVTEVSEKVLDKHGRVKRGKNGQVLVEVRKRRAAQPILDPRVDEVLVTAGVLHIALVWKLAIEPMLPRDLQAAA